MSRDNLFRALADPTRRQILKIISDGEQTAGDIATHFQISAPSMSHHFNVLKSANLVYVRRDGQQLYYALNTSVLQDVMVHLMDIVGVKESAEDESKP